MAKQHLPRSTTQWGPWLFNPKTLQWTSNPTEITNTQNPNPTQNSDLEKPTPPHNQEQTRRCHLNLTPAALGETTKIIFPGKIREAKKLRSFREFPDKVDTQYLSVKIKTLTKLPPDYEVNIESCVVCGAKQDRIGYSLCLMIHAVPGPCGFKSSNHR